MAMTLIILAVVASTSIAVWLWHADQQLGPRSKRIDLQVPVLLRLGGSDIRTRSIDLSNGGMCMEMDDQASVGQPAEVQFSLPDSALVNLHGVVRWRAKQKMGIQFDVTDPRREMVADWLSGKVKSLEN